MIKIEYVSDITFAPIAKSISHGIKFKVDLHSYDISQHIQRLRQESHYINPDVLILHCTSEYYCNRNSGFWDLTIFNEFIQTLEQYLRAPESPWVIINTFEPSNYSFVGMDEMEFLVQFHRMNAELALMAASHSKLRLLNISAILAGNGIKSSKNEKNNYIMKLPYKIGAIEEIASGYIAILEDIYLSRKKVLVLDADNTLWGGIIGEDGCDGVKIDPVNYPGVAYWNFQKKLKEIKKSGILLALVSKNNDADIEDVFNSIQMPLALEDFTIRRVNWINKSSNISEIANDLNLGLDSFVFIDDNIFEIEQVRSALPEVSCYQFPAQQPEEGLDLLKSIDGVWTWRITTEDMAKAKMYAEEVLRQEAKSNANSLHDYLESLSIVLEYGVNRKSQITRVTQLINKTNQFNLTTRRYSENEVGTMMLTEEVYDFRVIDRYGDMGIVGVCIVKNQNIDTFLMSCRALGREVESTMLKIVCRGRKLTSEYMASKKNQMVNSFYDQNGFKIVKQEAGRVIYSLDAGPNPKFEIPIKEVK
jgi:FkbH-like protein